MPRSLLIATGFPPQIGGIQTVLYRIITNLPSGEVIVLTPAVDGDGDFDVRHRFRVHRQRTAIPAAIASTIQGMFSSVSDAE